MDVLRLAGLLVAQITPPPATPGPSANTDALAVPVIALKRWYGSLTLSSPDALPNRTGVVAILAGFGALLLLAIVAQGPKRALGQLLDLPGLARLVSAAMGRLRRSGRLVAILLGATVVAWTAWQTPLHNKTDKKEELALLLKSKSRGEFAVEQGVLAALTPLRDVLGLGDTLVLLVGASAIVFKFSADRWGRLADSPISARSSVNGWTTLCWGGAGLYAMYRLASLIVESEGLPPLGGCLFVEIGAAPLLMLLGDGLLLAWVLVELRGPAPGEDDEGFDVVGTITLVPAATLACLVGLPARYVATTVGLAYFHHLPTNLGGSVWISTFLRGWGLVWLQAASLALVGLVGVVAWSRATWPGVLAAYARLLRAEGGHLAALLALVSLGVGGGALLAYYAVLAMPAQPWVLLAADSYAHYASLPIGLVGLAALVELGGRVSPPQSRGVLDTTSGVVFPRDFAD